jgi:hypothetical protein
VFIEIVSRLLFEPLSRAELKALAGLPAPERDHMRATPPRSAARRRRKRAQPGGGSNSMA